MTKKQNELTNKSNIISCNVKRKTYKWL